MSSANSAAINIGRIGGLAVALGIGAALASGAAIASAEADGSASSSHDSSSATDKPSAKGSLGPKRSAGIARAAAATGAPTASKSRTLPAPSAAVESVAALSAATAARKETVPPTAATTAATTAAQPAAAVTTPQPAAASTPRTLGSSPVGWVTGQLNAGYPGFNWAQTNNTAQQGIYGTDLGIMWENGLTGKIQMAFGDTFSGPGMTGNWRSNALLLSTDTNLTDGLQIVPTGYAYQFIPSAPGALFPFINSETTIIPTAAISIDDEQYVNYMSVKSWDTPGRWTTNYNAISMYNQATDKWELVPSTIRSAGWFRSSTPYVPGSQNFQQAAYVLQPEDQVAEGETQYLYAFGTPAGRAGSAYLSRVAAGDVTDLGQYQYWDGANWVSNAAYAAPIIGDSTHSAGLFGPIIDWANDPNVFGGMLGGLFGAKTGGNVSEMSVQYNEYLDKYVVLYGDGYNNVQMRTADTPEGAWSDPVMIATSIAYPGLYAPYIHPWSGTGKLTDSDGDSDVSTLYWNMSLWGNYNVVLMETDLSPLHLTEV